MSEAKHTPGPWLAKSGNYWWTVKSEPTDWVVASIAETDPDDGTMHAANARLIAAAPDLLDELKDALASFKCTQKPEHYPQDHWSNRAIATIAKVTGV